MRILQASVMTVLAPCVWSSKDLGTAFLDRGRFVYLDPNWGNLGVTKKTLLEASFARLIWPPPHHMWQSILHMKNH